MESLNIKEHIIELSTKNKNNSLLFRLLRKLELFQAWTQVMKDNILHQAGFNFLK